MWLFRLQAVKPRNECMVNVANGWPAVQDSHVAAIWTEFCLEDIYAAVR